MATETFGQAMVEMEHGYIEKFCVGKTLQSVRRDGHVFTLDFGDFVIHFNPNYQEKHICTTVLRKKMVLTDPSNE